jgi:phage baseplate assembly protein W
VSAREHVDLRLVFREDGNVDLDLGGQDLELVSGVDNLVQALQMRLLVYRGELTRLAHPRYGSRVHELIGEPLDRPNLELLRRYVRAALLADPRVASIERLDIRPLAGEPGSVSVSATVRPDPRKLVGPAFEFGVILDVG